MPTSCSQKERISQYTEHEDRAAYIVEGTVGQHCAYIGGGIGSNDLLESSLGCDPTPLATASRAREF
jgi:hypothetical protein